MHFDVHEETGIRRGTYVRRETSDHHFEGHVVALFNKLGGQSARMVVQDQAGLLHVYPFTSVQVVDRDDEEGGPVNLITAEGFAVGDVVEKVTGDYTYEGVVVAILHRWREPRNFRYVVENDDGCLHVFNSGNIKRMEPQQRAELIAIHPITKQPIGDLDDYDEIIEIDGGYNGVILQLLSRLGAIMFYDPHDELMKLRYLMGSEEDEVTHDTGDFNGDPYEFKSIRSPSDASHLPPPLTTTMVLPEGARVDPDEQVPHPDDFEVQTGIPKSLEPFFPTPGHQHHQAVNDIGDRFVESFLDMIGVEGEVSKFSVPTGGVMVIVRKQ